MGAPTDETLSTEAEENSANKGAEPSLEESVSALSVDDLEGTDGDKKKKKKSKPKGLDESAASLSLDSVDGEAPDGTKKKKKKKSKGLGESGVSLSAEGADDSASPPSSPTKEKKKKVAAPKSPKKNKDTTPSKPNDVGKIIPLVTEEMWKSEGASSLESLYALLKDSGNDEAEPRDIEKNREMAFRLGAPLLMLRKMKDFEDDIAIQSYGLNLLRCFGKLASPPWFELVAVGGLERATKIVRKTNDVDIDLRMLALTLLEEMAAKPEAAELLAENNVVSVITTILRNEEDLRDRALEMLKQMCSTSGHQGRLRIAESARTIVENTEDPKMLGIAFSLLTEMIADEEKAKGLVEGGGLDALGYALQHFQNNLDLILETHDVLLPLGTDGGKMARQAIVDKEILKTVAQMMRDYPMDVDIQKRSCQLILAMSKDQRKAIKDSGLLTLISKLFTGHRKNKELLKFANKAMKAIV